jgi:hypothetical protein
MWRRPSNWGITHEAIGTYRQYGYGAKARQLSRGQREGFGSTKRNLRDSTSTFASFGPQTGKFDPRCRVDGCTSSGGEREPRPTRRSG